MPVSRLVILAVELTQRLLALSGYLAYGQIAHRLALTNLTTTDNTQQWSNIRGSQAVSFRYVSSRPNYKYKAILKIAYRVSELATSIKGKNVSSAAADRLPARFVAWGDGFGDRGIGRQCGRHLHPKRQDGRD